MKFTVLVLSALICCSLGASVPSRLGLWASPRVPNGRIVGGWAAPVGAAPYQVSLRTGDFHFCGGSVVNNYWILTAAHCVIGSEPSDFNVTVGTNQLSEGGDSYTLDKVIWHNFDFDKGQNDLALLRTTKEIVFGDLVSPVVLELDDDQPPAGTELTLTGWGATRWGGSGPNLLQLVYFKSLSNNDCRKFFEGGGFLSIDETQICSYGPVGQGACNGDSGGPLNANGRQVGIVSWGVPPCAQDFPDIYTRVSSFRSWIKDTIWDI